MKFIKIVSAILLILSSSCAMMMNDSKTDKVRIDSSPQGADITIDGQYYGQTPSILDIEAKNYTVKLDKKGYGSASLELSSWLSSTKKGCVADSLGIIFIIPLYSLYNYCGEFKQKDNFVQIPRTVANNVFAPTSNNGYYTNKKIEIFKDN